MEDAAPIGVYPERRARIVIRPAMLELCAEDGESLRVVIFSDRGQASRRQALDRLAREARALGYHLELSTEGVEMWGLGGERTRDNRRLSSVDEW
jgi:hypothetical protein